MTTRWGTWIKFVCWIFENFSILKKFISKLTAEFPTEVNKKINLLIDDKDYETEIRLVNNFNFLSELITKLESGQLSTEDQIKIISEVLEKLKFNDFYHERFKNILNRNPDIEYFRAFNLLKCPENEKVLPMYV